ncbi:hypothetical protein [Streptomyces sp. NPDC059881]|uniref:hypothetical protein n=1 Tax=Streptomyces sp. NPDC059881 TaxID=3346986 RepID=UPI0036463F8A
MPKQNRTDAFVQEVMGRYADRSVRDLADKDSRPAVSLGTEKGVPVIQVYEAQGSSRVQGVHNVKPGGIRKAGGSFAQTADNPYPAQVPVHKGEVRTNGGDQPLTYLNATGRMSAYGTQDQLKRTFEELRGTGIVIREDAQDLTEQEQTSQFTVAVRPVRWTEAGKIPARFIPGMGDVYTQVATEVVRGVAGDIGGGFGGPAQDAVDVAGDIVTGAMEHAEGRKGPKTGHGKAVYGTELRALAENYAEWEVAMVPGAMNPFAGEPLAASHTWSDMPTSSVRSSAGDRMAWAEQRVVSVDAVAEVATNRLIPQVLDQAARISPSAGQGPTNSLVANAARSASPGALPPQPGPRQPGPGGGGSGAVHTDRPQQATGGPGL